MIFSFVIPGGGAGTVRAESWYDAREYLRSKGVDVSTITLADDLPHAAWTAPPANATPAEVAADYAKGIHALGVLEGVRECVRMIDAGDRDRSVRRGIADGIRATYPGAFPGVKPRNPPPR